VGNGKPKTVGTAKRLLTKQGETVEFPTKQGRERDESRISGIRQPLPDFSLKEFCPQWLGCTKNTPRLTLKPDTQAKGQDRGKADSDSQADE
jgi:hypothetical protein